MNQQDPFHTKRVSHSPNYNNSNLVLIIIQQFFFVKGFAKSFTNFYSMIMQSFYINLFVSY